MQRMNVMKILISFLMLILFCCGSAVAGIENTMHDFSDDGGDPTSTSSAKFLYRTNETKVCIFCHTPHGGSLTGPLWNRDDPDTASWTYYDSATLSTEASTSITSNGVGNESLLCLSCHDGSIGVNNLLNFADVNPIYRISPLDINNFIQGTTGANRRIGGAPGVETGSGHLEDDHPISFNYETAYTQNGGVGGSLNEIGTVDPSIRFFNGGCRDYS